MKKFACVLPLVLAATASNAASSNIQFVAHNASLETNLCIFAAQNGYDAAIAEAKKLGKNTYAAANMQCNGESIKSFAQSFEMIPVVQATPKEVVVIAGNQSEESQLCLKAVKEGLETIGHKASSLTCNGQPVASFVKAVAKS
ncbi:hypothetical protein [Colwellia sp. MEBiC06753]